MSAPSRCAQWVIASPTDFSVSVGRAPVYAMKIARSVDRTAFRSSSTSAGVLMCRVRSITSDPSVQCTSGNSFRSTSQLCADRYRFSMPTRSPLSPFSCRMSISVMMAVSRSE